MPKLIVCISHNRKVHQNHWFKTFFSNLSSMEPTGQLISSTSVTLISSLISKTLNLSLLRKSHKCVLSGTIMSSDLILTKIQIQNIFGSCPYLTHLLSRYYGIYSLVIPPPLLELIKIRPFSRSVNKIQKMSNLHRTRPILEILKFIKPHSITLISVTRLYLIKSILCFQIFQINLSTIEFLGAQKKLSRLILPNLEKVLAFSKAYSAGLYPNSMLLRL